MAFPSLKLKSELGANGIKNADDAYLLVAHMRLAYQNKPHWQMARQALNNSCVCERERNLRLANLSSRGDS